MVGLTVRFVMFVRASGPLTRVLACTARAVNLPARRGARRPASIERAPACGWAPGAERGAFREQPGGGLGGQRARKEVALGLLAALGGEQSALRLRLHAFSDGLELQ